MSLYVYVLSAGDLHQKIGITSNLNNRIATLQTAHYLDLTLIHSVEHECAAWIEARCHALLKARRLRGEWFLIGRDEAVDLVKRVTRQAVPMGVDYTPPVFTPGEKVVCIADHIDVALGAVEPIIGQTYVVEEVHKFGHLSLIELPHADAWFCPTRFRAFQNEPSANLVDILRSPVAA